MQTCSLLWTHKQEQHEKQLIKFEWAGMYTNNWSRGGRHRCSVRKPPVIKLASDNTFPFFPTALGRRNTWPTCSLLGLIHCVHRSYPYLQIKYGINHTSSFRFFGFHKMQIEGEIRGESPSKVCPGWRAHTALLLSPSMVIKASSMLTTGFSPLQSTVEGKAHRNET